VFAEPTVFAETVSISGGTLAAALLVLFVIVLGGVALCAAIVWSVAEAVRRSRHGSTSPRMTGLAIVLCAVASAATARIWLPAPLICSAVLGSVAGAVGSTRRSENR